MEAAIAEREKNGPFTSFEDFAARLDNRAVNKKLMEALVKAGAFDFTGELRAVMFAKLEQVLASAAIDAEGQKIRPGWPVRRFRTREAQVEEERACKRPPSSGPRMKSSPLKRNCSASTSAATRSTAIAAISTR
jgi:DNA polymerase III alpha subunit